jgi:hypothetical protein
MNKIERYIVQDRAKSLGSSDRTSDAVLVSAVTLLAEAEALMNTCRRLIDQSLNLETKDFSPSKDRILYRDFDAASRFNIEESANVAEHSPKRKDEDALLKVSVDVLEVIVQRFPDLIRGTAVFLVALMENGGQIVSHIDMQAILRSSSRSIMKVHASKLRKSLREKNIDVSLLSVKGGYGLSHDSVAKIISGIGLTSDERSKLGLHFPSLRS